MAIAFQGADADLAIPNLIADDNFTGGSSPNILVQTVTIGGAPVGNPTLITSLPNSTAATSGNDAEVRIVINGNQTGGSTGLVIAASQSIIRGLAVEGFGVGISIPSATDQGDLIQGNSIGEYLVYPVDSASRTSRCRRPIRLSSSGWAIRRKAFCWARPTRRWAASRPRTRT